jgi:hypothetical protein
MRSVLASASLIGLSLAAGCMPVRGRPAEVGFDARTALAAGGDIGTLQGNGVRVSSGPWVAAASRASAVSHPVGRPCSGLVLDPGACRDQPLVQRDELLRVTLGAVRAREPHARLRTWSMPYVGVGILEQTRVGIISGARDRGDGGGPLFGYATGVQYNPFGGLLIGIEVDAALILPLNFECDDCGIPYENPIGLAGLALTASWLLR